jgi:hypothetical protein
MLRSHRHYESRRGWNLKFDPVAWEMDLDGRYAEVHETREDPP